MPESDPDDTTLAEFDHPQKGSAPSPDVRPVIAVYVVWHPGFERGFELAERLFKALCSDPEVPARRGLSIPVRFRCAAAMSGVPTPIPFGIASHTIALVLCDDMMASARNWHPYLEEIQAAVGVDDRLIPVTLTSPAYLPVALAGLQSIRLHKLPAHDQPARLVNDALHDICRCLDPTAAKVRVFVSHAKADGQRLARDVCRHLREEARLDDFFDAADIPDGVRFADFLKVAAGSLSALLAIQTDAYGSREWCRLEVIEAKRRQVPIVVLGAVKEGEARSFPYLGNVPAVRWRGKGSLPAVVGALLSEVLRVRYFPLRVESLRSYHGVPAIELLAQPPELITALVHRLALTDRGEKVGKVLYPDPPLGSEELRLLHEFDPDLDPVTPTTLLAS